METSAKLCLLLVLCLGVLGCDSDDNTVGPDSGNEPDATSDSGNQTPDATDDSALPDGNVVDGAADASDNTTRTCGQQIPNIPSLTQKQDHCAADTGVCLKACVDAELDEDAQWKCRNDCTDADPQDSVTVRVEVYDAEYSVDCRNCGNFELQRCTYENGCATEWANMNCCLQDTGCTDDCTEKCAFQATAL